MLKVSQMEKLTVYKPKKGQTGDVEKMKRGQLSSIGKIHLTVCSPSGKRVVGFLIRRPDIAGMIKQKDAFIALDSFAVCDYGLVATRGDESFDDAARERLHLPWDKCIIWAGMDAKTTNGRELGWVNDFSFDAKSGKIQTFFVGDGGVASSLVGFVEVPSDMLRGYENGFMLLDPEAAKLALDGGLAAKAGEGYAKAKIEGKAAGKKAAKVAGTAVEKGAYGLGRLIGKAKRSIEEYQRDDEETEGTPEEPVEVESISEPVNNGLLDEAEPAADELDVAPGEEVSPTSEASQSEGAEEAANSETKAAGVVQSSENLRTFVPASEVVEKPGDASQKASGEQVEELSAEEQPLHAEEAEGSSPRIDQTGAKVMDQRAGSPTEEVPGANTTSAKLEDPSQPGAEKVPHPKVVDEAAKGDSEEASSTSKQKAGSEVSKKATQPTPKQKSSSTKSKSSKSKATKAKAKSRSAGDEAARAFGRGLGKMNSMFGSFVDEYKKSSK